MLHGDTTIAATLMVFDVLAADGLPTTRLPYAERRALLEQLDLEGPHVRLVAAFDDGAALYDVVVAHDLEGVVAKRERDRYLPGERAWLKTKNPNAPRFLDERKGAAGRWSRRS